MPLFQPKHQKLILQCYPPGRGSDKKPNSSELSYLLYYASTRRVKLEKVGKFLQKKNDVDVNRNRTGNIQVTLEIINALIKKCPDDLNVFAYNVNSILLSIFKTKDLALSQHASPVFQKFCETLDGELFSGDLEFVNSFTKLSENFLLLGSERSQPNADEWKALSLKAAISIAHCKNISQRNGGYLVKKAIPLVLSEIENDLTQENIVSRIVSHASDQGHELSRFNTVRTTALNAQHHAVPQSPPEVALDELAIEALKAYFSTNSTSTLAASTREVTTYLAKGNVDLNWTAALIEMITTWVPVQLRFIILSILTNNLDKHGKPEHQLVYVHAITSLLSSSVNLVGLSVVDNLRNYITLQKYLILNNGDNVLISAYSEAIGSLATHIYYQDQILDIVSELLLKIKDTNNTELIIVLVNNIIKVLNVANTNTTVQKTFIPLEVFSGTFHLLANTSAAVQAKYIELLLTELKFEYSNKVEFTKADNHHLISNARDSVLNQLFESIESITNLGPYLSFFGLLELIFVTFGINAAVNYFPFFFAWQLQNEHDATDNQILLDNISFAIFYIGSQVMGYDYLADTALSRIDYRKKRNIWSFSDFPNDQSHQVPEFLLTKEYVSTIISQNGYSIGDYESTILSDHYKYIHTDETDSDVIGDQSVLSINQSQNLSLSMLIQPPSSPGEAHSIKSVPLSARSLLIGKLNVPKVQELRKAISGNTLGKRVQSSSQKTDITTLLDDLKLDTELDSKGSLGFRYNN